MSEFQSSDKLASLEVDKIAENRVTAKTGQDIDSSSSQVMTQLQRQLRSQAKVEKTLSSLENSIKQIKEPKILTNQAEKFSKLLQQHQTLDESIKQIHSQLSDLVRQISTLGKSFDNIVNANTRTSSKQRDKRKDKKKNKKAKDKKKKKGKGN